MNNFRYPVNPLKRAAKQTIKLGYFTERVTKEPARIVIVSIKISKNYGPGYYKDIDMFDGMRSVPGWVYLDLTEEDTDTPGMLQVEISTPHTIPFWFRFS